MGRRSLIRFVAALLATLVVGGAALLVVTIRSSTEPLRERPPDASLSEPFALEWRVGNAVPFREVHIAADGAGCEVLKASRDLYKTCVLTPYLDPRVIAGEAFGNINVEPTPALEALIWRGILSRDSSVCDRGGLVEPFMGNCVRAVQDGVRTITDEKLTVRIGTVRIGARQ